MKLKSSMEVVTGSPKETLAFGRRLGEQVPDGAVICLQGELGAGKTTLIKGIASGVTGLDPEAINSPTFVYLNVYRGQRIFYHFDLYRLRDVDEFLGMGFEEYWGIAGVCCIEWSERIAGIIPADAIMIKLSHVNNQSRRIRIEGWDGCR